ncbi:TPA: hypothetical protein SAN82_005644 [Pseudomonas putida]|nr:hypothetical protein [Pseudomonas putida]
MIPSKGIIEIRTLDDINALYVIDPECILTKETYCSPLRPYRLITSEAKCQYLKKGKRCSQEHQHGFVVECKNGKQVLIGNCCAFNHLGLDDEQVKGDFRVLSAKERQDIRRYRIETLLGQKEHFIERVKTALKLLWVLHGQANQLCSILPAQVVANLTDRWKRNSMEVFWEYMIVKKGTDERGKSYQEKRWYPHSYGMLRGLGLWLQLEEQGYTHRLYEFRRQLEGIPAKQRLTKSEIGHAEAALNQVTELSVIERELQAQSKLMADFVAPGNLLLTIQLFANKEVRAKAVEAVHQLTGESCKTTPERFVADIDQTLQRQHSADGIRIAS